ncbi:MAG: YfhO family protein [Planctomycetota bacterium]|nr:YfhO family protein [Planctomycetota bacterium]MDG2143328.1 YfhO family protein [Planctomycetota bacterium]
MDPKQENPVSSRRPIWEFLGAAAAIGVVLAFLFRGSLFGGEILSQADALLQFAPWSDVAEPDFEPSNPLLLDQGIMMEPWLYFAGERIQDGQLPLWNPNNFGGQPMVDTYQSAYFWPLHWLYFAAPSWQFFAWSAFLRLWAAGLFTYLFLRAIGVRFGAALTGSLGFAMCGFMVAWLGHMHTNVALFLPAFLWAVERLAKEPTLRRTGVMGLLVGLALFGGHIQTATHLAGVLILYTLFRARFSICKAKLDTRGVFLVGAAGILGIMLAMPQLLPFFDYLEDSMGAYTLENLEVVSEVDVGEAASMLVSPGHLGSPAAAQGYGPYTGTLGANMNYSELIGGYAGRLLFILALLQLFWLRRGRATIFFGALAVLSALVAWQVFPFYDVAHSIPKLRSTKLLRLLVFTAFSISVLGAMGLDGLAKRMQLEGKRVAALFSIAFIFVAVEMVSFASGFNPSVDGKLIAPATPVTDFLQAQADGGRILGLDNTALIPSANLFYDLPMVTGYDSIESRTFAEVVALMTTDENAEFYIKEIRYFDRGFQIADLLGVRYLLSSQELPPPFELALEGPTKVYRNPTAMDRLFLATDLRVIEDKNDRLAFMGSPEFTPQTAVLEAPLGQELGTLGAGTAEVVALEDTYIEADVNLDAPGILVLADAYNSGWHVKIDDEPARMLRVDHTLRGVVVPEGQHKVTFGYAPTPLLVGAFLGAIGLILILGLILMGGGGRANRQTPPPLF